MAWLLELETCDFEANKRKIFYTVAVVSCLYNRNYQYLFATKCSIVTYAKCSNSSAFQLFFVSGARLGACVFVDQKI